MRAVIAIPALALALAADVLGDDERAQDVYQDLKFKLVSRLPKDGWALTEANMFKADLLERGVRDATIILGNPPFESFDPRERGNTWLPNELANSYVEPFPLSRMQ